MKKRVKELRKLIAQLNDEYYNKGESSVSDEVYDSLKAELTALEPGSTDPLSPINQVGAPSNGGFDKFTHPVPMLSLDNVFDEGEVIQWLSTLPVKTIIGLEYKLDGASLELVYRNNKLFVASTRGDGEVGDDVTENACYFRGIPFDLPSSLKGLHSIIVRGEVIIKNDVFHSLNTARQASGKTVYANPRNAVAGLLRSLDADPSHLGKVTFIAYDLYIQKTKDGEWENTDVYAYEEDMDDFILVERPWMGVSDRNDELMDAINRSMEGRADIGYDIDGMVIKVLSSSERKKLGSKSTTPRWATAYKFQAQTVTSILRAVEFQVGRTGVITPVAKIDPVVVCGVTVSSVTLHNLTEIERLDLRLSDTVVVSRRGDVIPKIESVVVALREDEHGVIGTPDTCPSCGEPTTRSATGIELLCTNKVTCPAQLINRMAHFVSRDGIDVKYMGPAVVEALIVSGSLGSFNSLFYLNEDDFYQAGVGSAMTAKILDNISKVKTIPFFKVLRAVGLPEIGDSTARSLAEKFHSFVELMSASEEDITSIADIGPAVVSSIMTLDDLQAGDLTNLDKTLTYVETKRPKAEQQDLAGMTVVVTGSVFEGRSRKEMEEWVQARGAKLSKSVSKNTDVIYVGAGAGPDKLKKAKALGITQVSYF